MNELDLEEMRQRFDSWNTQALINALATRGSEEWVPDAYAAIESVLTSRQVDVEGALSAKRESASEGTSEIAGPPRVVVLETLDPIQAEFARGELQHSEIPSVVAGASAGHVGVIGAGFLVLVEADDEDRARAVLAQSGIAGS